MSNHGFMLIDVIIYSVLSVILSLLILSFCQRVQQKMLSTQEQLRKFVADTVVLDVVRRELQAIDQDATVHDWAHTVYRVQALDARGNPQEFYVGWEMHERGLARVQGQYCKQTATWSAKTVSLMPFSRKVVVLDPQLSIDKKRVTSVCVRLKEDNRGECDEGNWLSDTVKVRNGALV